MGYRNVYFSVTFLFYRGNPCPAAAGQRLIPAPRFWNLNIKKRKMENIK